VSNRQGVAMNDHTCFYVLMMLFLIAEKQAGVSFHNYLRRNVISKV